MTTPLSRRRALSGAATLGVSVPLLAACSEDSPTASDPATTPAGSSPPASSPPAATTTAPAASGGLVAVSEVPVGGGVVVRDEAVVVTQPVDGEFKAFTAICTHQACLVSSVSDGSISCPCHGSKFSATDGSATSGPASAPLEEIAVEVADGQVRRA